MIKMSVRPCPTEEVKKTEPELEFYLKDSGLVIFLKVREKTTGHESQGHVLSINKKTGELHRCLSVSKEYGLPLDGRGRMKFRGEL